MVLKRNNTPAPGTEASQKWEAFCALFRIWKNFFKRINCKSFKNHLYICGYSNFSRCQCNA